MNNFLTQKTSCFVIFLVLILSSTSCTDPDNSFNESGIILTTTKAQWITFATAISSGTYENPNEVFFEDYGVCWSKEPNPEITDFKNVDETTWEYFIADLCDLEPNTTYYYRAFIKPEGSDVVYANELQFTTNPLVQICEIDENFIGGFNFGFKIDDSGWTNGEFVLRGTSFNADFYAEFLREPKSGVYQTSGSVIGVEEGEISLKLSGGGLLDALQDQEAEVINIGDGRFEVKFCGFEFGSSSGAGITLDGHIVI